MPDYSRYLWPRDTGSRDLNNLWSGIVTVILNYMKEMLLNLPFNNPNSVSGYTGISVEIEHYTEINSDPEVLQIVYISDVRKYKDLFCPDYSGIEPWYDLQKFADNSEISNDGIDFDIQFTFKCNVTYKYMFLLGSAFSMLSMLQLCRI